MIHMVRCASRQHTLREKCDRNQNFVKQKFCDRFSSHLNKAYRLLVLTPINVCQENHSADFTVWFTVGRGFFRSDLRVPPAIPYSSLFLP